MNLAFPIEFNSNGTITTIYNSKITSIKPEFNTSYIRLDFKEETFEQMQDIINTVITRNKIEGNNYTNGNLNREI